jgi:hypothetical protein
MRNMNGQQPGDPAKLACALLTIVDQERPLQRFVAGADAIEAGEPRPENSSPRPRPHANWAPTGDMATPTSASGGEHKMSDSELDQWP